MRRIVDLAMRRSTSFFGVLALAASFIVIGLGLGLTFFADEWAFVERRSLLDPGTWWAPHNEHWSTLPVVVYGVIVEIVGLRSYVPFLVVLYGLHVVGCAALFVLVRRRAGPLAALGAASLGLLLGSGFENLFWGFQLGFVGSTAAGLWAIVVLDEPPSRARRAAVCMLLLAGLATSGIGLTFLLVAGILVLVRRDWRGSWLVLGIPAAAYLIWFQLVGSPGIGVHRLPLNLETAIAIPSFVAGGFANAAGAVLGVGPQLGAIAAWGVLILAISMNLRRRDPRPQVAIACAFGIAFQYTLIAAARAGVTEGRVDYTRYTYVGALLMLVAVADLARGVGLPQARLRRLVVAGVLVALLELGLVWNVRLLVEGRALFAERAMTTRALVTVALDPAYASQVADDRSLVLVPSPQSLRAIVDRYGSPLADALAPWAVPPVTPDDISDALRRAAAVR